MKTYKPWGLFAGFLALSFGAAPAFSATITTPGPVFVSIQEILGAALGSDILNASVNAPGGPGGVAGGYTAATAPATFTGFDPTATGALQNEIPGIAGVGALGGFDAHFEYLTSLAINPGSILAVNFDIMGASGELSDTLGITFTGHQPGAGDNNNISVDLHYRSDNETIVLSSLTNAINVNEANGFVDLSAMIGANSGPADFNLRFASPDVPEPSTMWLLSSGGLLLVGLLRRKRV